MGEDPWAAQGADEAAARAIDPAIPTSVPVAAPPSPAVISYLGPRFDPERLAHPHMDRWTREQARERAAARARARGLGLIIGGAAVAVFSLLPLIGGARLRARYNAWEPPPPDDECLLLCFGEGPPLFKGTASLTFGGLVLLSGLTMIGFGAYRVARPVVQRTTFGTWTTGISLRF